MKISALKITHNTVYGSLLLNHFSTGWSYTDGNRVEFGHL